MEGFEKMNVVIVADDGYIQHAGVMLTSLFETNKGCRIRRYFCLQMAFQTIINVVWNAFARLMEIA